VLIKPHAENEGARLVHSGIREGCSTHAYVNPDLFSVTKTEFELICVAPSTIELLFPAWRPGNKLTDVATGYLLPPGPAVAIRDNLVEPQPAVSTFLASP